MLNELVRKTIRHCAPVGMGAVMLAVLICPVYAQTTQDATAQAARKAAEPLGLKLDAGYRSTLRGGTAPGDDFYFRLDFKGYKRESGEKFTMADSVATLIDTSKIKKPELTDNDLLFRFENGAGNTVGPLTDLFKARSFTTDEHSLFYAVRGVAQVYGRLDDRLSVAVGAEVPRLDPIRGLDPKRRFLPQYTFWAIPGIQAAAEARSHGNTAGSEAGTTSTTSANVGLATWRAYFGGGFTPVVSKRSDRLRAAFEAASVSFTTPNALITAISEKKFQGGNDLTDDVKTLVLEQMRSFLATNPALIVRTTDDAAIPGDDREFITDEANRILAEQPGDEPAEPATGDKADWGRRWLRWASLTAVQSKSVVLPEGQPFSTVAHFNEALSQKMFKVSSNAEVGWDTATSEKALRALEAGYPGNPLAEAARTFVKGTPDPSLQMQPNQVASRVVLELVFPQAVRGIGSALTGGDTKIWKVKAAEFAKTINFLPDQYAVDFGLESVGQYQFAGITERSRLRNLAAATMTFYLNPKEEKRSYLRVRYENGIDRAALTAYRNQFLFVVGLDL